VARQPANCKNSDANCKASLLRHFNLEEVSVSDMLLDKQFSNKLS